MTPAEVYTSVRRCHPSAMRATESVSRPTWKSFRETAVLTAADSSMTAAPQAAKSRGSGRMIFPTAS